MKLFVRSLLLFSICLTESGCFPYHYATRPGLFGTVIDASNHKPITGAEISYGSIATNLTQTATDGTFLIPPEKEWAIWIFPQDVFNMPYSVFIQKVGYEPYNFHGAFNPTDHGKYALKQLGVISLKPLPQ
jgi:hypothetical protein